MRMQPGALFAVVAVGVVASGCASFTPAMPNPITEPVLDHPGRFIVRYRDAVIEVVIDTKFAAANLGEDWLILNVALSGMTGGATRVDRRMISARAPDGSTIALPSYKEFNAAFDDLASAARRAGLTSDPLDFTRGGRRPCSIDFFPLPGSGRSARTAVNVTKNELCVGMLFFPVRNGVQPGGWRMKIEFEETEAVVPFILEAE